MGGRRDEAAAPRRPASTLIAGFVLAALATPAVFLTDNPAYLRLAVIVAASAFLLAATAAVTVGRRGPDQSAVAAREAELRRAFEHELDREEAAHREIELQLENDLRREAQESVRYELDGLRREIAALSSMRGDVRGISVLRDQLAALPALRDELAQVSALRAEVAAMNALRDEVEALADLREEFGQLSELRAEISRLRTEITEQLSSRLLTGPATSALDYLAPMARSTDLRDGASPPTAEVPAIAGDRPRPQPFPRYERPLLPNGYARRPADSEDAGTDPVLRSTRRPAPPAPPAPFVPEPPPTGPVYVSEILAEQGTPPPSGPRHRRYRDEDTEDDVLSRVLRGN